MGGGGEGDGPESARKHGPATEPPRALSAARVA